MSHIDYPFTHFMNEGSVDVQQASTQHTIADLVNVEPPIQALPEFKPFYTEGVLIPHINKLCDSLGQRFGVSSSSNLTEQLAFIEELCKGNLHIREAVRDLRVQSAREFGHRA